MSQNLINTLESKSQKIMPDMQILLDKITSNAKKEKYATVEGSVAFVESEKKAIGIFLEELIGHPVTLQCSVNPEVLGGMRIQVGDWIVDATLKYQLDVLADSLLVS